jgi:cbb3-type cytochrome oxidase maturation protein
MEAYLVFTGLGVALAAIALAAAIWAIRGGQYDDLETPALRLLADDATTTSPDQP